MNDAPQTHRVVIQDAMGVEMEAKGGIVAGSTAHVSVSSELNEMLKESEEFVERVRRDLAAVRFARFLDLFSYLLPRHTRERVFEPVRQELLEDYLISRRYRTPWARRWLAFCFTVRTALMMAECIRVMLTGPVGRLLLWLIPAAVRRWCWLLW